MLRACCCLVLALMLSLSLGCGGGSTIVPVSGIVTLDGQPLANAAVTFQPKQVEGNMTPGTGSGAKTDANGVYSLMVVGTGQKGAVVGPHVVEISCFTFPKGADPTSEKPGAANQARNRIPANQSKHEFTVPAGGTDKADFNLKTK